jgi:hypothetical protein
MAKKKPDLNDLQLCVDRPIVTTNVVDAAMIALNENEENEPPPLVLRPGVPTHPLEMALGVSKKWSNGRKIGVRFLDGSPKQKKKVQQYAEQWEQFANINFDFSAKADAEIRVSFKRVGSWSALGTDCLHRFSFPKSEPTMNYGWLKDDSMEEEWRRVVLHEFGHALGAIHEHQNPQGGIQWNEKEVHRVFSGPPNNWTKQQIDFNILQKYSVDSVNASTFDAKSIMLYGFSANLIVGGKGTTNNRDLSDGDKKFIAANYPKTAAKPRGLFPRLGVAAAAAAPMEAPEQPKTLGRLKEILQRFAR